MKTKKLRQYCPKCRTKTIYKVKLLKDNDKFLLAKCSRKCGDAFAIPIQQEE